MMVEFPTDLHVKQAAQEAAKQYIGSSPLDDRSARLEILVDVLRLEVPPGSTKQTAGEAFLRRSRGTS
jgi:hypothetical protein